MQVGTRWKDFLLIKWKDDIGKKRKKKVGRPVPILLMHDKGVEKRWPSPAN
jgi:hypothetical protein